MTGSVTLRELVPMDVAKRLTMTAEVFDGRQAASASAAALGSSLRRQTPEYVSRWPR